jgi:hypothetical protein
VNPNGQIGKNFLFRSLEMRAVKLVCRTPADLVPPDRGGVTKLVPQ